MKIVEDYDDETLKMKSKFVLPEDKPFVWDWQMFVWGLLGAMFIFACGAMR